MTGAVTLYEIGAQTRAAALLTKSTVEEITQINAQMNMLGLNARIEAARLGAAGAGFALVANEVRSVSAEIAHIANGLGQHLTQRLTDLDKMVSDLAAQATGTRLVDAAFTAIDLIDRNLYERSCDVRWWATDADVVAAAAGGDLAHAARRLGVILDAYTVYADIWLADLSGRILCNGRADTWSVAGHDVAAAPWFAALRAAPSAGFIAGDAAEEPLLGGQPSMAWAAHVRSATGTPLGILITQFDWGPQAKAVLDSLRFGDDAGQMTAMICDAAGRVLARRGPDLGARIALPDTPAGWRLAVGGLMGHHRTEGFETWSGKGWNGVVVAAG